MAKHDSLAEPEPITIIRRPEAAHSHRPRLAEAVRAGLLSRPKTLPWQYFYDGRLGPVRADLRAARVLPDPHRGCDPPRPRRRDGGRTGRRTRC